MLWLVFQNLKATVSEIEHDQKCKEKSSEKLGIKDILMVHKKLRCIKTI